MTTAWRQPRTGGAITRPVEEPTGELDLLQGFELRHRGVVFEIPQTSQRVVAFLAIHERTLHRPYVAGSLWPDVSETRADGSLRSAIWRMSDLGLDIVAAANGGIRLSPEIRIDMARFVKDAHQLDGLPPADLVHLAAGFERELLPDWYDDWIIEWRERWRQIRFHALEEVAGCLIQAGLYGRAIEVGLAAVRAEPLRESAHRVVIQAHLTEGNRPEAIRQFREYEELLRVELRVAPSPKMLALVDEVIRR
jgi:DNA-binding SARP family transcriptional activator